MKKLLLAAAAITSAASFAGSADREQAFFDKIVEMQQHNRLSIHLDEKCKYLKPNVRNELEAASKKVGQLILVHPMNNMGSGANTFVDVKMHERSIEIPCNNKAKAQVKDTLRIARQFMVIINQS
ncbi:hypothetical protein [Pseudoalteromonas rubra]|uniref:Uncharacterized protein n=1 Tax=Pseudoalteromonas rubra TaxID=43658 RepID=A0A5S3X018_9GAMM|nr:hypothetical protein [Pseudoalteromonas rubra]TMP37305.1 hypothetical protein CWB98_11280 [Pseudoalteromonas rubra]